MFPEIIVSPSIHLSTWGLFVSAAALAVLWLGRRNAPARGISAEIVEGAWPWLVFGGFFGAHLYYLIVVGGWPFHHVPFAGLINPFSGTAVQGGLLGGIIAAAAFLRYRKISFLGFCDVLAPAGALAQALTRVGCFAAGCCYGRPTHSFLGVVYTSPYADAGTPRGVPLHPAQLYEAVLDLCLAAFLQSRLNHRERPGRLFAVYLMGSALIRFSVQFFRDDDAGRLLFGLAHSQYLALAMLAVAAWLHQLKSQKEATSCDPRTVGG